MSEKRTVLVEFKEHSRVVLFNEESDEVEGLRRAVNEVFADVFPSTATPYFLQLFSNEWNRYVDVCPGQEVPDKSLIRIVLSQESKQSKVCAGVSYLCKYIGILKYIVIQHAADIELCYDLIGCDSF